MHVQQQTASTFADTHNIVYALTCTQLRLIAEGLLAALQIVYIMDSCSGLHQKCTITVMVELQCWVTDVTTTSKFSHIACTDK